ncbi:MAG: CheR family methyltransferase [Candidatus Sulfotelmatobacter sp.]
MHKLLATSTILEHELTELRLLVERQAGVVLDCSNNALATHVADYIEAQDLGSAAALLERLRSQDQDPASWSSLLNGLVNSNTGFYRHPGALNALARQVVPQLCARKSIDGPSPLRIWSAGCSTGEETYSIAMAVCDAMSQTGTTPANIAGTSNNGGGTGSTKATRNGGIGDMPVASLGARPATAFSLHIVGSDLLPRNIETADRGVYPQSALEGLPPAIIRNYFSKISAPGILLNDDVEKPLKNGSSAISQSFRNNPVQLSVKPRLRSLVTFNCMNLARPGYIGRFEVIFCMDVLPHFSRAQRIALLERLHLYLEPGGYLFLSQTEKLASSNLNFRSETFDGYTFHRKPLAASAAYGR